MQHASFQAKNKSWKRQKYMFVEQITTGFPYLKIFWCRLYNLHKKFADIYHPPPSGNKTLHVNWIWKFAKTTWIYTTKVKKYLLEAGFKVNYLHLAFVDSVFIYYSFKHGFLFRLDDYSSQLILLILIPSFLSHIKMKWF